MLSFLRRYSRPLGAAGFFLLLMVVFLALSPRVFLNLRVYAAVFESLPVLIFLVVPLVFVIAAGEIDLSFPSVVGLGAWAFALAIHSGWNYVLAFAAGTMIGAVAGLLNGVLVTRVGLSSLVSTLGMNFFFRGFILLETQGNHFSINTVEGSTLYKVLNGDLGGFPVQMIWAVLAAAAGWYLFARHRFGSQICCVGDNQDSAREMGISVVRVKTLAYVYMGISAGVAGIFSCLLNFTFWPSTGDGYMLSTLAAVFIGGTPVWGGVGTVLGGVIGAFTVSFIATGIVAAGLTGFFVQFFYGLVIILAILGHRFNQKRYQ
ncbi:MAG TPA: ABC transporter permease [Spirochaetia bacterium]|nr:ABC transporter permease [Spirochaetia bacterium]